MPYALTVYDWHPGQAGVKYLFDEPAARERAAEVAAYVDEYRAAHRGRPVFIVGHSAGAGIAVFAAEEVGAAEPANADGPPLAGIVIIAPSLSPEYDLTRAIEACGGRMAACSGALDGFIWFMSVAAHNIDGTRGTAAGQSGFRVPDDAPAQRREEFEHLVQIRWRPSMMLRGNLGGHTGWASASWVKAKLAPLIVRWGREWDT